jgi:hypothetical protein
MRSDVGTLGVWSLTPHFETAAKLNPGFGLGQTAESRSERLNIGRMLQKQVR